MKKNKSRVNKRFEDYAPEDWRKRPRRDANGVRSRVMTIRMTTGELDAIKEQAAMCEMTLSDYVVCRCLRIAKRVSLDMQTTMPQQER